MKYFSPLLIVIVVSMLSACNGDANTSIPSPTKTPQEHVDPQATEAAIATDAPVATDKPVDNILQPEPQDFTFQAEDGQALQGRYYPAAVNPAPLVVLFHWVNGDMTDWNEIAVWLQNRGMANPYPNPGMEDWWDPEWFDPVPETASYAVAIITYRGCQPYPTGCPQWTPDQWLLDTQAAMMRVVTLDGIDPTRVVTIGSSIGADGAINGCTYLNEMVPGSCLGAASLTPGDYLTLSYGMEVDQLDDEQPPKPAWCFAPTAEIGFCQQYLETYENLTVLEFKNAGHGNLMLQRTATPSALQAILDFLALTVGP